MLEFQLELEAKAERETLFERVDGEIRRREAWVARFSTVIECTCVLVGIEFPMPARLLEIRGGNILYAVNEYDLSLEGWEYVLFSLPSQAALTFRDEKFSKVRLTSSLQFQLFVECELTYVQCKATFNTIHPSGCSLGSEVLV